MKALCRLLKYPSRFAIIKAKKAGKVTPDLESIILIHHAKDFPAGNPHGTPPGQGGDKPGGLVFGRLGVKERELAIASSPQLRDCGSTC